jgi:hypothetical protein
VIGKGYIIGEASFGDDDINSAHDGFSIVKSFTSALVSIVI